ncbi:MAG: hypothetical protein UT30_C0029G0007 [Candidatus Uhrbacteria bacterium GW2011_GWF2_39_13]|uniref:Uncharacterized protein n=1 Tax=Candidatus Uhrbacteria bacterium GW2011_GWF2_39_13 TaxID=1618995 RepID=A0A0G0MHE5_9BACT|nr:MAG: hypothetical protein UT30_C0029G0007 [Candidatus Uhrbacteria bacterium GW2011_GWF2_39_13]
MVNDKKELLIMRKRIDLEASPVLYDRAFTQKSFVEGWEVRNAEWWYEDGAFYGKNSLPAPGVIISKKSFPGNVLMDFYGQTVLPSKHDINVMWNLSWNEQTNTRDLSYVAGVQGWWEGKVGIEKSPEYKVIAGTSCPWFVPGKEYHIQAGSINGHCFIFVDGKLQLEMMDPEPIDSIKHNRVGFEAYQSIIRIRDFKLRQIVWQERNLCYSQEF